MVYARSLTKKCNAQLTTLSARISIPRYASPDMLQKSRFCRSLRATANSAREGDTIIRGYWLLPLKGRRSFHLFYDFLAAPYTTTSSPRKHVCMFEPIKSHKGSKKRNNNPNTMREISSRIIIVSCLVAVEHPYFVYYAPLPHMKGCVCHFTHHARTIKGHKHHTLAPSGPLNFGRFNVIVLRFYRCRWHQTRMASQKKKCDNSRQQQPHSNV